MKRKAILIDQSKHNTTLIMIDIQNAKDILPYIMKDGVDNEFKEIRGILKENIRNKEKYKKVDVSEKAKNMYEMRFIRSGRNDRIYCQEISISGKRFIVMVELHEGKKSQDIQKKIKTRIETMGGYEYELEY
jgi:GGDEF domain-containing protein